MSALDNFIKRSKEIYGEKNDYSKVVWRGCKNEVTIHCNIHDLDFVQKPSLHYHWEGCPECSKLKRGNLRRSSTEEFIKRSRLVHGDKYDYSKVEYKNNSTKVVITCPEHGDFEQIPTNHLSGSGCPICLKNSLKTEAQKKFSEGFLIKAKEVHDNKYDYSKVNYVNSQSKVVITCPIHGDFLQKANKHLRGQGCPKCFESKRGQSMKVSFDEFVKRANEVHGYIYDYGKSKETFKTLSSVITIVCPTHGEFRQKASTHLNGCGCQLCASDSRVNKTKLGFDKFVEKAVKIHGHFYDYSKVVYVNRKTDVVIVCPEHGEFNQKPSKHLNGHGCPLCSKSKLENEISVFLTERNIQYEQEKRFKWLGKQRLDFYLPEYNVAIECQGIQHFKSVEQFGGEEALKQVIVLDKKKRLLCEKNGVKLLYYTDIKEETPYEVFKNKNKLFENILKKG